MEIRHIFCSFVLFVIERKSERERNGYRSDTATDTSFLFVQWIGIWMDETGLFVCYCVSRREMERERWEGKDMYTMMDEG